MNGAMLATAQAFGKNANIGSSFGESPQKTYSSRAASMSRSHTSLQKIRTLLNEGGLFFVDIVDFRAAYRRGGSVEAAIKIDHPYYLTEQTMLAFLRRHGFEVLAVDYAADHLHVGYVCAPAQASADFLPGEDTVSRQWREIRFIQNPLPDR